MCESIFVRKPCGIFSGLIYSLVLMLIMCGCGPEGRLINEEDGDSFIESDFCSGRNTGTYYYYSGGLIDAAGKKLNMKLHNRATAGSIENASLIADGTCGMGILQEDTFRYLQNESAKQTKPEDTVKASKLRVIMVAYNEDVHLLVNTTRVSDIDGDGWVTAADLAGKKIGVGEAGSGTYITSRIVLDSYGFAYTQDVSPSADALVKVVSGELDAMFTVAAVPYTPFADASLADADICLIRASLKPGTQSEVYCESGIIDYSVYPFQRYTVEKNLQVKALVVVSDDFNRTGLDGFYSSISENKTAYAETYNKMWSVFGINKSEDYLGQNPLVWEHNAAEIISGYSYSLTGYNFYAGSIGGSYMKIAGDMSPYIEPYFGFSLEGRNSEGSIQNAIEILKGNSVMSIVQDDLFDYLKYLDDSYEGLKVAKMRKVMALYNEDVHILVNNTASINSISDFGGKNICMCEKTSGSFVSGINIINSYGFDQTNAPNYHFASPQECIAGVINGTYDAMVKESARPYSLFQAISAEDASKVRMIAANVKDGNTYYNYFTGTIPRSDYPLLLSADLAGNAQVTAVLVIRAGVDDSDIGDFIGRIYSENAAGTFTSTPRWADVTPASGEKYFKRSPYGWSPAAAKYFSGKIIK